MTNRKTKELDKLFAFFYSINKKAYKNKKMLPNQVLSKNLEWGDILKNYYRKNSKKTSVFRIFINIGYAYFRNFYGFIFFILKKIAFDLSGLSKPLIKNNDDTCIIIDTYFLIDTIISKQSFEDIYFPGLFDLIKKTGQQVFYTPKIPVSNNPINYFKAFKILKEASCQVFTEYQGITWVEMFEMFLFILSYPIQLMLTGYSVKETSLEAITIKRALYESLKGDGVVGYSRYLFGRRLSRLPYKHIKCISWYENQSVDKCFYKGLREAGDKVKIYGAQFFLTPSGMLHTIPDKSELQFGIIPNVILVNGPDYLPKKTKLNYRVGPSLRYKQVFKKPPELKPEGDVLVLLPYYKKDIKNIFHILRKVELNDGKKFIIKFHPTTNRDDFVQFKEGFCFSDQKLYDLFKKVSIVLGFETGSLVEAVSQGIPAIHLEKPGRFNYNPLPEFGKGFIWEVANNSKDVQTRIVDLLENLKTKQEKVSETAMAYRKLLFNKIEGKEILKVFDL